MPIKLANNATSTIATAINASDVGVVLATGDGAKFPALAAGEYFYITFESSGSTYEIAKATARVGDTLTIVRAQEGTTAQSFAAGSRVELRVTAASINDLVDEHDQASEISFVPYGWIAATNVQDALEEVSDDISASSGSSLVGYLPAGAGAVATTVQAKLRETVSVKDFGAVGDGVADDTVAIQNAITSNPGVLFFPQGTYKITSSVIVLNDTILQGEGKNNSLISLSTLVAGTKAIDARAYRVSLQRIGLVSASGNSDGLGLIGFFHSRVGGGSVGRNDHNNFFISGFSDAGMRIEQAISYSIRNADINCNNYGVHIKKHNVTNVVSTTVTLENIYTSGGNQGGIYLDSVSNVTLIRCVMEYGGDAANANSAAFVNALSGRVVLYSCYFEANYRDIYSTSGFTQIGTRHGVTTVPDVIAYNPGIAFGNRGLVELTNNRVITRFLTADTSYVSYIEVEGEMRSTDDIITESANLVAQKALVYAGNYQPVGRADNDYYGARFAVNASNILARDTYGSVVDLGTSFSGFSGMGYWMRIQQRMSGNSNHKLDFIRMTGTFYDPDTTTATTALTLTSTSLSPGVDNAYNLGSASLKWSNVYAANGTIITSDQNEKQQVRSLTEKETAVAKRIKSLIKAFKFNDAVAKKGDKARIHFGVIAQEVADAFSAEGLNADEYGLFCKDSWYEYDGKEVEVDQNNKYVEEYMAVDGVQVEADEKGNFPDNATLVKTEHNTIYKERLGIRYDELAMFILSAI